jgi:hypothetical protein
MAGTWRCIELKVLLGDTVLPVTPTALGNPLQRAWLGESDLN